MKKFLASIAAAVTLIAGGVAVTAAPAAATPVQVYQSCSNAKDATTSVSNVDVVCTPIGNTTVGWSQWKWWPILESDPQLVVTYLSTCTVPGLRARATSNSVGQVICVSAMDSLKWFDLSSLDWV